MRVTPIDDAWGTLDRSAGAHGASPPVQLRPSFPMAEFVRSINFVEADGPLGRESVLPSGNTTLMVNLLEDEIRTYDGSDPSLVHRSPGAVVVPPRAEPTTIETGPKRLIIVNLEYAGPSALLSTPVSELCGERVALAHMWGAVGASLRDRTLEAPTPSDALRAVESVLTMRLMADSGFDFRYRLAAKWLDAGATVASVRNELALPARRFTTQFRDAVGLAPKTFARIRRIQHVVDAADNVAKADWARLAVDHGFYDQAHLINDFRQTTGMTPVAYLARSRAGNHVRLTS